MFLWERHPPEHSNFFLFCLSKNKQPATLCRWPKQNQPTFSSIKKDALTCFCVVVLSLWISFQRDSTIDECMVMALWKHIDALCSVLFLHMGAVLLTISRIPPHTGRFEFRFCIAHKVVRHLDTCQSLSAMRLVLACRIGQASLLPVQDGSGWGCHGRLWSYRWVLDFTSSASSSSIQSIVSQGHGGKIVEGNGRWQGRLYTYWTFRSSRLS